MISKKTWIKLLVSISFFLVSYWLVRQANVWVKLAGLFFVLVFPFSLLSFWKDVSVLYALINNTFDFIHRIQKEICSYVDNIFLIHEQGEKEFRTSIKVLSNKITKEFIQEEIRQLDYNSKKIHLFQLIFAFWLSFIVVYVTGDQFVVLIKNIAKLMNLLEFFPIINDLTVQTFWLIFLFPLSIAWSRDLIVEVSKKYSKKLHQSLFLIGLHEND